MYLLCPFGGWARNNGRKLIPPRVRAVFFPFAVSPRVSLPAAPQAQSSSIFRSPNDRVPISLFPFGGAQFLTKRILVLTGVSRNLNRAACAETFSSPPFSSRKLSTSWRSWNPVKRVLETVIDGITISSLALRVAEQSSSRVTRIRLVEAKRVFLRGSGWSRINARPERSVYSARGDKWRETSKAVQIAVRSPVRLKSFRGSSQEAELANEKLSFAGECRRGWRRSFVVYFAEAWLSVPVILLLLFSRGFPPLSFCSSWKVERKWNGDVTIPREGGGDGIIDVFSFFFFCIWNCDSSRKIPGNSRKTISAGETHGHCFNRFRFALCSMIALFRFHVKRWHFVSKFPLLLITFFSVFTLSTFIALFRIFRSCIAWHYSTWFFNPLAIIGYLKAILKFAFEVMVGAHRRLTFFGPLNRGTPMAAHFTLLESN